MTGYEIVSLIISTLSLIATIAISFVVYSLGKKSDEKRLLNENKQKAREFIIDHESEIAFIPLCLIASNLNRHHKHHRQIYNDFNKLDDEIQKEVLKQLNYELEITQDTKWVDSGIDIVRKFISENKLSESSDFLYDGAKYFHRAFNNYSELEYNSRETYVKKYKDFFGWEVFNFSNNKSEKGLLTFSSYFEAYMVKVINEKNELYKDSVPPITYLIMSENLHSCEEENVCFWIMEMVNVISAYLINTTNKEWILNTGDAFPETFEDRYYDVLTNLYNLTR